MDVDLEPLPAYEPAREVESEDEEPRILSPIPTRPGRRASSPQEVMASEPSNHQPEVHTAPDEPPPGYEEAQAQAVGIDLEQRLREEAQRQ